MISPSPPPSSVAAGEPSLAAALPPRRRLPPPCWSHDETLTLIKCYRVKWHSLRRGNLRAADWEELAADVTSRCSCLPSSAPKTSVQCRHKIEKLRKRFRSERLRSSSSTSPWPFFHLMESLDSPLHSDFDRRNQINGGQGLRFTVPKALRSKMVKSSLEEMRRRLERRKREEKEREGDSLGGVISALRMIGDGFMRMERMKMDIARKNEKIRMEMELKRTEMMLDLHDRIVDGFLRGFVGRVKKKGKVSSDA